MEQSASLDQSSHIFLRRDTANRQQPKLPFVIKWQGVLIELIDSESIVDALDLFAKPGMSVFQPLLVRERIYDNAFRQRMHITV